MKYQLTKKRVILICIFSILSIFTQTLIAQNIKTIREKNQLFWRSSRINIDYFDTKGQLIKTTDYFNRKCKDGTIAYYFYNDSGQLIQDSILSISDKKVHTIVNNYPTDAKELAKYFLGKDIHILPILNKNQQLIRVVPSKDFHSDSLLFPHYNPFGLTENLQIQHRKYLKETIVSDIKSFEKSYQFDKNKNPLTLSYNVKEGILVDSIFPLKYYEYDDSNRLILEWSDSLLDKITGYSVDTVDYIWNDDLLIKKFHRGKYRHENRQYRYDFFYDKNRRLIYYKIARYNYKKQQWKHLQKVKLKYTFY